MIAYTPAKLLDEIPNFDQVGLLMPNSAIVQMVGLQLTPKLLYSAYASP